MKEKISVIMACYNCEATLPKAVDSILAQTYTNWVMICCDDGSTDGTYEILSDYKDRYPDRFVLIQNEENRKLAYSLNRCLERVETEYVARQDADDESFPERFEKQIAFLRQHPDRILCGTKILFINDFSGKTHVSKVEEEPNAYTLHHHTPFNHATILCRKEMYELLGGYTDRASTVRCEDKDLWYRFFLQGLRGSNLKEPLYQLHENEELISRNTASSRWNDFVTDLHGYRLLRYPWYWYGKPFLNLIKTLVPKKAVIWYYKKFRQ